jgi:type I site-specific restriction-modification system R (restriction) subunit
LKASILAWALFQDTNEILMIIVGAEKRIALIADDLVKHWKARLEVMEGKAMIVA